jgi:hypothetical protein
MIGKLAQSRIFVAAMLLAMTFPVVAQRAFDTDILTETFGFDASTTKLVELADLHQGCQRRDCIPSIDSPRYVSVAQASHVDDDDVVLALSLQGYHRAWPAKILDQHEIVNDFIAGQPIAITWCPLCGSAVGVVREIDGQVTEFGVSGLLYNSDLVFYDRKTETLWDQVEAKGIVGPLAGTELELVPVTMTRWGKWKSAHPDTLVLSPDTGFAFDYSRDAYGKYRDQKRLMFPVANTSNAIHSKSVVFGFDFGDQTIAFTESLLEQSAPIEHEIGGQSFDVTLAADGEVRMTNRESGEEYFPTRIYWFAWYTFHPETELVRQD